MLNYTSVKEIHPKRKKVIFWIDAPSRGTWHDFVFLSLTLEGVLLNSVVPERSL